MKYSGFWIRFAAAIIDVLILIIPFWALQFAVPYVGGLILSIVYYPIFESSPLQATPGKFFMGLRLLDEKGQTLSFARATARFFLKYLSSFLLMIGYLIQLFTTKRQTLHDLIVNAVVIDVRTETDSVPAVSPDWFDIWLKQIRYVLRLDDTAPVAAGVSYQGNTSAKSASSAVESIEKLHELYKSGVLTEDEFQTKKAELLKLV